MELNKQHREQLLDELKKAKEDKERAERLFNQFEKVESLEFRNYREIDIFLAQERIKLIEQSLINNEIDY